MHTATKILRAFTATVAALSALPASADAIVNQINVAVNLTNMPAEALGVHVNCYVCTADCQSNSSPPATVVSAGYAEGLLAGGALHGMISVPITPLPQAGNAVGTDYLCAFLFVGNSGEVNLGPDAPAWAQPQPGTPFTPTIKGTIADALAHPVTQ